MYKTKDLMLNKILEKLKEMQMQGVKVPLNIKSIEDIIESKSSNSLSDLEFQQLDSDLEKLKKYEHCMEENEILKIEISNVKKENENLIAGKF